MCLTCRVTTAPDSPLPTTAEALRALLLAERTRHAEELAAARDGRLTLPADDGATFVPVMMATPKAGPATPITIETAGVVVRAECGVDVGWLAAVLGAVKALS